MLRREGPTYIVPRSIPADTLYDEDFYAWTQQQAAFVAPPACRQRLRRRKCRRGDRGFGTQRTPHRPIAGRTHHRAFLKLEFSRLVDPAEHWRDEIVEWRLQLDKTLTGSIEAKLVLPARYRAALRLIRRLERDVPGLVDSLPPACPYTLEQIVSGGEEDWFPPPRPPAP